MYTSYQTLSLRVTAQIVDYRLRKLQPLPVATWDLVAEHVGLHTAGGEQDRDRRDQRARLRGHGVGADLEHLGRELVTHVDVGVEVEVATGALGALATHRRHALHLLAEGHHLVAVLGEVLVGAADPASLHLHEHLTELGGRERKSAV